MTMLILLGLNLFLLSALPLMVGLFLEMRRRS